MRLFLLTGLTMLAFAANSLLNRAGLASELISPGGFALLRVASGAVALWVLLGLKNRSLPHRRAPDWPGVLTLTLYLIGFSFAYVSLDAGLGALILFTGVQITMFVGAVLGQEDLPLQRWFGMALSLLGLAFLSWPHGDTRLNLGAATLMALAALGWGIYSLLGRRATDPLAATAWNFVYATPAVAVIFTLTLNSTTLSLPGIGLAILSGAVTSGVGYALWYNILPALGASRAALAQLSVPVIALGAGALVLGEEITLRTALSSALILGGIALGLTGGPARRA